MVPLLILLLVLVLVVFPVWALFRIAALGSRNKELEQRLGNLEREFLQLRTARGTTSPTGTPIRINPPVVPAAPPTLIAPPREATASPLIPAPVPESASKPYSRVSEPAPAPIPEPPRPLAATPAPAFTSLPPPLIPASAPASPARRFDWEQFTGAKLLAWTGGAAAFLGAAFFIKYSFEHDLIPPAMRVAIGYAFALALVVAGLRIRRPRYAPTAQTFCATGIVCLYAVTFASNSIYDFPFFTPLRTFLLMAVITGTAFLLAVRLDARVVAVLGMLGGFLTPVLLSTGRDNAFGLFGYIALLDVGLAALALYQRWFFLVPLGAAGTVAMQLGWAARFLNPAKAPTAMIICLVFCGIFVAAHVIARMWIGRSALARVGDDSGTGSDAFAPAAHAQFLWPAIALPCVAFLFALGFIGYRTIAAQPGLLFGFVFAVDVCLLALAWLDDDSSHVHLLGGLSVFALLAVWTGTRLTDQLLPWALGLYLIHGIVHTSFPLLLERRRPGTTTTAWNQLFPPLALVLMLVPFFKLDAVSFALWPCVLLVDLLAIGLAILTGSLLAMGAALVLTLAATTLWLFRLPPTLVHESSLLLLIGGFSALFFGAGIFVVARQLANPDSPQRPARINRIAQLPAFSALMPFVLLVLMTQRLPVADPTGVFGLALLLVLLCLVLTRAFTTAWLPACALAGVALLEYAWHMRHFNPQFAGPPFTGYVIFYGVFTIFPFVFRSHFAALTGPWAVAALAGVVQFPLVYRLIQRTSPNDVMGLVPALFAIAPLAGMLAIHRGTPVDQRARLNQLAWFGGTALFFLTLIVPVQFEREWITLGWACEGAALLWLFRRVPHPGLRATAVVLLVSAFVRLALNPAVLEYHVRSAAPLLNWYLYTYGAVVACLYIGAALVPSSHDRALGVRIPPLLNSLGTVLAFLLLNIEIADFFSPPGARVLTFQFSGNFARDMTYTIAWALFALGLLLVSIWKHARAGRYAALALLGAAVVKLFLHDLERLGALHRIGALFAVAIIAIVASLAYQRFLPSGDASAPKR